VRVPFIARWKGKIPAGTTCREPAMTIDLFPTIARLTGAKLPERKIDGLDIWPLLVGESGAKSPHEALYFYWLNRLDAVRGGRWKLHFAHDYPHPEPVGGDGKPGTVTTRRIEPSLFDLESDIGETTNVAEAHPDIVARLTQYAEAARLDLGDAATKRTGSGVREPGRLPEGN
jgi:arylsulfatase A-like enzyme